MSEKTKVIAKTVIHRTVKPGQRADKKAGTSAVKPEVQVIQPGTVFMTKDQAEYDYLLEAGAIRAPERGEKVEVDIENVTADEQAENAKKALRGGGSRKPKTIADMTGSELDEHLETSGHEAPVGWSTMKVDDKRAWLVSADAGENLV